MAAIKKFDGKENELERKMKIRKAKRSDISQVYSLGKETPELEFSRKYLFHEKEELIECLKDKDSILIIAEDNKQILGFLLAKIIYHKSGGWCMLDNLIVNKNHRGEGISDNLINKLYELLKREKIRYVNVLIRENQRQSRRFWEHQKFKETKKFIWAERTI